MQNIDELGRRAAAALHERSANRSVTAVAPSHVGHRRSARLAAAGAAAVLALVTAVMVLDPFTAPAGQVTVEPAPTSAAPTAAPTGDPVPLGDGGPHTEVPCEERAVHTDLDDGWAVELEEATLTEPVAAEGLVIVGTVHEAGEGGDAACVFAFAADSGELAWSVPRRLVAGSTPVVADGLVIVPFTDAITAFDATTGQERWSTDIDPGFDLAVTDELVLTVAWDRGGGHTLHALDLRSGRMRWQTEGEVWEPLHVHAGTASVRTRDGGLRLLDLADGSVLRDITVADARHVMGRQDELLFTLRVPNTQGVVDAETGALIWESNVPGAASTGLLVEDGRLVVAADVGEIYGIGLLTGTYDWRTTIPAPSPLPPQGIGPTPVVVDGKVHVGTEEGIVAVEAATGAIRWTSPIGEVTSPLTLRDGMLYAAADGDLVAVDARNGNEVWRRPIEAEVRVPLAAGGNTVSLRAGPDQIITIDIP